jgi:arginine decarboxylase
MTTRFKDFIGTNIMQIDVTVFEQVDSLHRPSGPIKEAQSLAADAFNADHTFFCVHGTSGAIHAMLMGVVREGEKIIIPRNVHKSVTAGLILSGAVPVYVQPEIDSLTGTALNVTPESIQSAIDAHADVKAVLIINPTYFGVSADIRRIASIVHKHGIPLMVDEAHGPHLQFHDRLPVSAMDAGADICAQSTHKIIGSLTQSSMLHVRDGLVDANRVRSALNLLHTTSPSYILLASLDAARMQMAVEGSDLLEQVLELADYARTEINRIDGFYCFGHEYVGRAGASGFDPTKITITCRLPRISGQELEHILAKEYFVQVELSDLNNVLCVFTFGDTRKQVDALLKALREISARFSDDQLTEGITKVIAMPRIPLRILSPRDAVNSDSIAVPLSESAGEISAEFLLAYPPGIPALCPGEMITAELIAYIETLKAAGLSIQGTDDAAVNEIRVIRHNPRLHNVLPFI